MHRMTRGGEFFDIRESLGRCLRPGWRGKGGHSRKHGQKDRLRRNPEGITGDFSGNQEDYDEKHPFSNFLWL